MYTHTSIIPCIHEYTETDMSFLCERRWVQERGGYDDVRWWWDRKMMMNSLVLQRRNLLRRISRKELLCRNISRQASSSSGPMKLGQVYVRSNEEKKSSALVVFLHGLGDTGEGWSYSGLDRVPGLEHVKWCYPSAPVQPVRLNMDMPMPSWFDINSLDLETTIEDEVGMYQAADAVHAFIDQEGFEKNRVVVAGFSQGGAVALLLATQVRRKTLHLHLLFLHCIAFISVHVCIDIRACLHGSHEQ